MGPVMSTWVIVFPQFHFSPSFLCILSKHYLTDIGCSTYQGVDAGTASKFQQPSLIWIPVAVKVTVEVMDRLQVEGLYSSLFINDIMRSRESSNQIASCICQTCMTLCRVVSFRILCQALDNLSCVQMGLLSFTIMHWD